VIEKLWLSAGVGLLLAVAAGVAVDPQGKRIGKAMDAAAAPKADRDNEGVAVGDRFTDRQGRECEVVGVVHRPSRDLPHHTCWYSMGVQSSHPDARVKAVNFSVPCDAACFPPDADRLYVVTAIRCPDANVGFYTAWAVRACAAEGHPRHPK
jgi:hypothetical protein